MLAVVSLALGASTAILHGLALPCAMCMQAGAIGLAFRTRLAAAVILTCAALFLDSSFFFFEGWSQANPAELSMWLLLPAGIPFVVGPLAAMSSRASLVRWGVRVSLLVFLAAFVDAVLLERARLTLLRREEGNDGPWIAAFASIAGLSAAAFLLAKARRTRRERTSVRSFVIHAASVVAMVGPWLPWARWTPSAEAETYWSPWGFAAIDRLWAVRLGVAATVLSASTTIVRTDARSFSRAALALGSACALGVACWLGSRELATIVSLSGREGVLGPAFGALVFVGSTLIGAGAALLDARCLAPRAAPDDVASASRPPPKV
jgi:hypothetical protein